MSRKIKPPKLTGYHYTSYLGSGGFADVFMYQQELPNRQVAVKVWHHDISADIRQRFVEEANVMAAVSSHPSIIEIYSAGIAKDGRPYVVMEYCPPPHLGKRVKEQPFSVQQTLQTAIHLAGAVETAHRAGIIHRDIKPANVLINRYGRPVLTDFGIASTRSSAHTAQGVSLAWSSPEQQRGSELPGPRSDIFSLGATIFAMLAGDSPFRIPGGDNSPAAITSRIFHQEFRYTGRADVPLDLDNAIARCLAVNPHERFGRALDFAYALQRIQRECGYAVTEPTVLSEPDTQESDSVIAPHFDDLPRLETRIDTGDETRLGRLIDGQDISADQAYRFTMPKNNPLVSQQMPSTVARDDYELRPRPQTQQRQPRSVGAIVAVIAVVLALVGFVGYTVMSGYGQTQPTATTTSETVVDPQDAGLDSVVPTVDKLTAKKTDTGAKVVWINPQPRKGDTYLWQIGDGTVNETSKTSIDVPWEDGTCVEVTLRRDNGQSSQPARVCKLEP